MILIYQIIFSIGLIILFLIYSQLIHTKISNPSFVKYRNYYFNASIILFLLSLNFNLFIDLNFLFVSINIGMIILIFFYRYVLLYDYQEGEIVDYKEILIRDIKLPKDESEVVILFLNDVNPIVVPLILLQSNDHILNINLSQRISVTYCLFCNTVHSYHLPEINKKSIKISSKRGTILNGNKILSDHSGNFVWQQFNGKSLFGNAPDLKQVEILRTNFRIFKGSYKEFKLYRGKRKLGTQLLLGLFRKTVSRVDFVAFDPTLTDKRLSRKELIYGIMVNGTPKAYQMKLFDHNETTIIHDVVDSVHISLVNNMGNISAFKGKGLTLKDGYLQEGNETWDLFGNPDNSSKYLTKIKVTSKAYWYMWIKFNPGSLLFDPGK